MLRSILCTPSLIIGRSVVGLSLPWSKSSAHRHLPLQLHLPLSQDAPIHSKRFRTSGLLLCFGCAFKFRSSFFRALVGIIFYHISHVTNCTAWPCHSQSTTHSEVLKHLQSKSAHLALLSSAIVTRQTSRWSLSTRRRCCRTQNMFTSVEGHSLLISAGRN